MTEREIQSYGLASYTAAKTAAVMLGVESGRHPHDLAHPDVVRAQRRFEEADADHQRWIVAAETVLETEVRLPAGGARAGDSSKVRIVEER